MKYMSWILLRHRKLISEKVSLVVPGPEQPLVDGVETYFRKGIASFAAQCGFHRV